MKEIVALLVLAATATAFGWNNPTSSKVPPGIAKKPYYQELLHQYQNQNYPRQNSYPQQNGYPQQNSYPPNTEWVCYNPSNGNQMIITSEERQWGWHQVQQQNSRQPQYPQGQPLYPQGQHNGRQPQNPQGQPQYPQGQSQYPQGHPNGRQPQYPQGQQGQGHGQGRGQGQGQGQQWGQLEQVRPANNIRPLYPGYVSEDKVEGQDKDATQIDNKDANKSSNKDNEKDINKIYYGQGVIETRIGA